MYAPDPEDCLLLHYEFTGNVKLDQVVCQLNGDENIAHVHDDYQLEISDHVYHQCVMRLSRLGRAESSPTESFISLLRWLSSAEALSGKESSLGINCGSRQPRFEFSLLIKSFPSLHSSKSL